MVHVPVSRPRRFRIFERDPLLILLHGSGEDGQIIQEMTQMDSVADRHHMIVAYPDGTRSILGRISADWNSGDCCGYAARQHIDDIGFLRGLIDDLTSRGIVDSRRIYIAGFSSGAELAFRAGCEIPDRIAAIAVVSGSIAIGHCDPARSVSLLAIQGTADDEVPFDDELPDSLDDPVQLWTKNVTPSVRYWVSLAGCTSAEQSRVTLHVERTDFTGCRDSNIRLLTIAGGIHGWPDADSTAKLAQPGEAAMHELDASETIARFLLQHRR